MYAKVFAQIYDGTLCTKGPWQALVTFQQLLVLADQEGNVDMTVGAIARRTTIPLEIIEAGIEELLLPDPESRTPAEGGRRIILLSEGRKWGWRIVNYKHYRQLQRETERREYHRQYWHTRQHNNSTDSTDSTNSTSTQQAQPNQPIAEANAEAKAINDGFDLFYKTYPKKVGKPAVLKAFKSAKLKPSELDLILGDIERRKQSDDWLKEHGKYIPNPATYLNQRRWEDEAPSSGQPQSKPWDGAR